MAAVASRVPGLATLARLYGVQTSYLDVERRRQRARPEVVLAVLRALGAPVATGADVPAAVRERVLARWTRPLEPVNVAWEGKAARVVLRRLAADTETRLAVTVVLEQGGTTTWTCAGSELPVIGTAEVEGRRYVAQALVVPDGLPLGYHRLHVESSGGQADGLLLCAPRRVPAWALGATREGCPWGVFLPLYAVRSARDWGCGDFTDLAALAAWVAEQGGSAVATLPLLATFLDTPFEPSPYAPASRLFWNDLFVDPERAPELAHCPAAQRLLASDALRAERAALRAAPLVDYAAVAALKRRVMQPLADAFFAEGEALPAACRRFVAERPEVEDYAAFRAACEHYGAGWPRWPEPARDGRLTPADCSPAARRYHLYAQWLAHRQLEALAADARARGVGLYLDLPLGVHPDGYDVWRARAAFVQGVSGGAPPDVFFRGGQDWGFPPLHPERCRADGYAYLRACLRHHLRPASVLRIDHVMGLHRLFWVPHGVPARDGVYVRYPAEELYAVLCLEAQRHGALIVGEDLGTVPRAVRATMERHGLRRLYVAQFELTADPARPLHPVRRGQVASVNTHDLYPFAAFWRAADVADCQALGLLDEAAATRERRWREAVRAALECYLADHPEAAGGLDGDAESAALAAVLGHLAASPAALVLVNLEDLWRETAAQNVPGTWRERPNWRRKARYSLEELSRLADVAALLGWVRAGRAAARDRYG